MTPIDHLPHSFGVADAEVLVGANRKHRLQDASQRLFRTKFHIQSGSPPPSIESAGA